MPINPWLRVLDTSSLSEWPLDVEAETRTRVQAGSKARAASSDG